MLAANLSGERRIRPETFCVLLVQHVPPHVRLKLEGWGVLDFCALFRRSIGCTQSSTTSPIRKIWLPISFGAITAISTNGTSSD